MTNPKLLAALPASGTPLWRLTFFACLLAVLVLSLLPQADLPPVNTGWDKADHAFAYLVLGLLGLAAFPGRVVLVFAGLVAFGGAVEMLQGLTTWRFAEWSDLLADVIGLAAAALVVPLWRRLVPIAA